MLEILCLQHGMCIAKGGGGFDEMLNKWPNESSLYKLEISAYFAP
jgi:hypothetical protein